VIVPLLLDLPGRDEARAAAERELSRQAYQQAQPSWLQRLALWAFDRLQDLLGKAGEVVPGGRWGLFVLALLVAGLTGVVVTRLRPGRRITRAPLFDAAVVRTAAEHRAAAESAAGRGDFTEAVTERFRAVVRELESRGVVEPRPGSTADEVARAGGTAVPAVAEPLRRAASLFDEVRYGGHQATAATYAELSGLDVQIRDARLVVA
jgi:hypothetical protein